jgi:hypothetical protein
MARHRRPAYEWEITPASHVDVLDLIVGADDGALGGTGPDSVLARRGRVCDEIRGASRCGASRCRRRAGASRW